MTGRVDWGSRGKMGAEGWRQEELERGRERTRHDQMCLVSQSRGQLHGFSNQSAKEPILMEELARQVYQGTHFGKSLFCLVPE